MTPSAPNEASAPTAPSSPAVPQNAPKCPTPANAPDANELTATQLKAIELLVRGHRIAEVLQALNVDRKTLYRWRKHDAAFKSELERLRRDAMEEAVNRLRALLRPAVDQIARQLECQVFDHRVRAAVTLLRLANVQKMVAMPAEKDDTPS